MFNSKYNSLLTVLLVLAVIAIISIIGYLGYSMYNKYYINVGAQDAIDAFEQMTEKDKNKVTPKDPEDQNTGGDVIIEGIPNDNSIYNKPQDSSKKTTYYGYNVVGTISIPAIKIEYPILEKVTTKSLKVAVAYLCGAGVNQVGNTVIQGHNLRNKLFFSNLSKLSNGDKIYIKDESGTQVTYEVYKNFTAKATDTSFYNRDTGGKREITLSTCTEDVNLRTIVLAREI